MTRTVATYYKLRPSLVVYIFTMASDELRTVLSPLLSREQRAIWITDNSYICLYYGDRTVENQHEEQFQLTLSVKQRHYYLSIRASTLEEAIICLEYLAALKDTHFEEMKESSTLSIWCKQFGKNASKLSATN
jgi:hypothetical protein